MTTLEKINYLLSERGYVWTRHGDALVKKILVDGEAGWKRRVDATHLEKMDTLDRFGRVCHTQTIVW